MQALTPEQYDRLHRLARAWERGHLKAAKADPHFNPRLGVDALCFQPQALPDGRPGLLGALITPVSLALALVPDQAEAPRPEASARLSLVLPSGTYPFRPLALDEDDWLWVCDLLDDLSDVASLQAGSRLAQRLMEQVMRPAD